MPTAILHFRHKIRKLNWKFLFKWKKAFFKTNIKYFFFVSSKQLIQTRTIFLCYFFWGGCRCQQWLQWRCFSCFDCIQFEIILIVKLYLIHRVYRRENKQVNFGPARLDSIVNRRIDERQTNNNKKKHRKKILSYYLVKAKTKTHTQKVKWKFPIESISDWK